MQKSATTKVRRLVIILGDQLDPCHPLIETLDPVSDRVFMAEVRQEATHVCSHKARIVLFLSAMRHYRDELRGRGITVCYLPLDAHCHDSLAAALAAELRQHPPQQIAMLQAGDARVQSALEATARQANLSLEVVEDPHFLVTPTAFSDWLAERKQPRMEHFYRALRKQTGILMQQDEPLGGQWNFDAANRASFGREGPVRLPAPPAFSPDHTSREVIRLVNREFPAHPGALDSFDWPVTPDEAQSALQDFVDYRLALFGTYEDAMWTAEPFLYHSLLSSSLNLKLLNPRAVLHAAEHALHEGRAPLASVEGFVRQILGWREYVRGIYWARMPAYADVNALQADRDLPAFFWSGDTDMVCLREVLAQTLRYGYAHHIQRLMVTGLFCLLLGVRPQQVHAWYLAVYVDAVEWVELPNTLGMSQYADGGYLASKPYVATGKYIKRMSNYCTGCRYNPAHATGDDACPFTTLYWDFLARHQQRFARHPRTAMQWRNLQRIDAGTLSAIQQQARSLRASC
ncbi:MAG: cryptochrome/photolyase family protein [Gammaproteobacteria bacterium]